MSQIQRYRVSCAGFGVQERIPSPIGDVVLYADHCKEVEALQRENAQLLNDASVWRNRAINAEEELAGTNRLRRATQPAPQELK